MEQLDRTAEIGYSNILALIKLRENYASKLSKLPSGVFKCILEYQFPRYFDWRYSEPYEPIEEHQDRHFPAIDKLD